MDTPYRSFQDSARRHADLIAIRTLEGEDLSYSGLELASREAGAGLLALGLEPGERVAIWGVNSIPWIIAGLGIQAAGGVLVTVGTRLRGREAAAILSMSNARILFCDQRFGDFDFVQAILAQDLPQLQKIIVLAGNGAAGEKIMDLAALRALGRNVPAELLDARIAQASGDDLADILFTSGTTGTPKGVPMTNAQSLIACAAQQQEMSHFTKDDILAETFPFAHNAGYRAGWQISLLHGARIIPVPVYNPEALLNLVQREHITLLPIVPTIVQGILDHPDQAGYDLSSLRSVATGGTTVPVALVRRLRARLGPHTLLQNGYGLTEAAGSVTVSRPDDDDEAIAMTAGRVFSNLELCCMDKEHRKLPPGQTGELAVRGPQVLHGYFNNPEATSAAFTADGFLLTGDAGWLDERGNLHMADRIKDMYLAGGFNCYPAEIENILQSMPGIGQVAIIGVDDQRLGQVGRAFIIRAPGSVAGAALTEASAIAWCKQEMANYKVPRSVRFLDALPVNATGKVDKKILRELA